MIKPTQPVNESLRLQELHNLNILDTKSEERFDRITRIVPKLFDVPIALISFVDKDRQWFKAKYGLQINETPRDIAFCSHTILQDDILIVEDALNDERFRDNPLVIGKPEIRFYLGCPVKIKEQFNIGTLCMIDNKSRRFKESDLNIVKDLAHQVEAELDDRHLSTTDELTQISNRHGLILMGNVLLQRSRENDKNVLLLYFDLNKFKFINEQFGREEGDKVLKAFSRQLLKNFRHSDAIARLGNDKFCVLCSGMSKEQIPQVVKRFQNKLDLLRTNYLGFSVGAIEYDRLKHGSIASLIEDADRQIYENKRNPPEETQ